MAEEKKEPEKTSLFGGGGGGFMFGEPTSAFGSGFGGGSLFGTGDAAKPKEEEGGGEVIQGKDPHFKPLVHLDEVEVKSGEEDEEELFSMRAKLFRYVAETKEFKERGVGNVKLLKHNGTKKIRLLMRRDKTLKLCANHYVLPSLEMKKNATSVRSWVWSTPADFSEEQPEPQLLAIRFANAENALKFKEAFEAAQKEMEALEDSSESPEEKKEEEKKEEEVKEVAEKLAEVKVEEKKE